MLGHDSLRGRESVHLVTSPYLLPNHGIRYIHLLRLRLYFCELLKEDVHLAFLQTAIILSVDIVDPTLSLKLLQATFNFVAL